MINANHTQTPTNWLFTKCNEAELKRIMLQPNLMTNQLKSKEANFIPTEVLDFKTFVTYLKVWWKVSSDTVEAHNGN